MSSWTLVLSHCAPPPPAADVICGQPFTLNYLPERMHSHHRCICVTVLHCVLSNVSSKRLWKMMENHTGYICLTSFHCVFSFGSSHRRPEKMESHTGCICLTFLRCVFSKVFSNWESERKHTHNACIFLFLKSALCVFKGLFKSPAWADANSN